MNRISKLLTKIADESENENRRVILSLFEPKPGSAFLDCGCGDGEVTIKAATRIGTKHVYGTEVAHESIEKTQKKGIKVISTDLNHPLPFPDEKFEVILASHVIEHLCDTDTFLSELHRVLKSGGYLVIATPNLAAILHIAYLFFGKQPHIAEVSDVVLAGTWSPRGTQIDRIGPAHRRLFTTGSLKELLIYYGFEVEKCAVSGFLPLPNRLAKLICLIDKIHASNIVIKARRKD